MATFTPVSGSTTDILRELTLAPVQRPEILPTVLPLLFGMVAIELYFGKHSSEELGWNSSVANAVIWVATGTTLLLSSPLTTSEKYATYLLIFLGILVAYMDFYHKWPSTVAFLVSSSGIVYSLAYVFVLIVKTGMPLNSQVLKAAAVFVIGINIFFKIVQSFEKPAGNDFGNI